MSKRGNTALNGILLIDKAQGWTSHDVVAKLRKLTGEGRIGHGGTLDPEATGLLVVLFGPATKLSDNLLHGEKSYRATISFGEATDTDDAAGRIVQRSAVGPQVSDADFARKLLEGFVGVQWQTPPAFSALKREGKVAYREARKGRILDIAPREIEVYAAELKDLDTEQYRWTVDFRVSKGSYIRALARDIGQAAGTVAHLSALRRTTSGAFRVQNAHRIETIEQACVTDPLAVADYFTCAGVPSFEPQGRRVSADNDSALPESCLYRLQPEDFDSREGLRIVSRPRLAEAAVALGTFDGVHEGHRALLQAAVAEAQGRGLLSVAVTFDPLPAAVIRPASAPAYLMTVDERCAAIRNCGIDEVIVVDFTPAFAQREAAWFVEQFLPTVVRPRVLLAGRNFRLGRGGECDVAGLDVLAQKNGMDFIVHDLIKDDTGEVISSTRLRAAVLGK